MISFLKLIRYPNLLMVILTLVLTKYVVIHSFVSQSSLSNFNFLIFTISIVAITAGGFVINDIFDVQSDKINKRSKVLIGSKISKKRGYIYYALLTVLGLACGVYLSFIIEKVYYSFIFLGVIIGLHLYSSFFKRLPLLGNIFVSFFVGFSIYIVLLFDKANENSNHLFAAIAQLFNTVGLISAVTIYSLFAFLTTLIREIIKDTEDVTGDYAQKMKTLPILIGNKRTKRVALFFTSILLFFIVFIIKKELLKFPYFLVYSLLFLVGPIGYFTYKLWIAKTKKDYTFLSFLMKIIMVLGILSMFFFKFK